MKYRDITVLRNPDQRLFAQKTLQDAREFAALAIGQVRTYGDLLLIGLRPIDLPELIPDGADLDTPLPVGEDGFRYRKRLVEIATSRWTAMCVRRLAWDVYRQAYTELHRRLLAAGLSSTEDKARAMIASLMRKSG